MKTAYQLSPTEQAKTSREPDYAGPFFSAAIICAWMVSIWFGFFHVRTGLIPDSPGAIGMILWIQFLFCGLFIVSHDACHGTACASNPRLNRWLGRIAAGLYAAFDFDRLVPEHHAHHIRVASAGDPDFHDGTEKGTNFFRWGIRFFTHYVRLRQILVMMAVAQVFFHVLRIPDRNVIQFWVLPALLSGVQLFVFGTWLPHRSSSRKPFPDHHHARDSNFPWWLSLLTCWHFGYHHTHHLYPGVPWFRLPFKRRLANETAHYDGNKNFFP